MLDVGVGDYECRGRVCGVKKTVFDGVGRQAGLILIGTMGPNTQTIIILEIVQAASCRSYHTAETQT